MTYSIKDNEDLNLYQYSSDKYLALSDYGSATAVQFVKGKDTVLITDIASDGTAPIPNQFLNGSYQGMVQFYLLDSNSTKIDGGGGYFTVKKNSFPEGYKFNGTECKIYKVNMLDSSVIDGNTLIVINIDKNKYYNFSKLIETADFSRVDTRSITSFSSYFNNNSSLKSLDLHTWNTENATTMAYMFASCSGLNSIDISSFNTSSVTDMSSMFANCSNIRSLDLHNFNTKNTTNMAYMFNGCSELRELNISNFNTQNVEYMDGMFMNTRNINQLDLSFFSTSKVKSLCNTFRDTRLFELNLNSFNTTNVTNMSAMLMHSSDITTLTLGTNWGINTSITSFDLSSCPLIHDSCLDVFNKLADKTQTATTSATLTLKSTTKALMSDTEIAIATNKGWTVS